MKRYRKLICVVGALLLVLVAVRLMLPGWVKYYANHTLDQIENFEASIQDVDIHLWRGAYAIHSLTIFETDTSEADPILEIKTIDLSVQWKALFRGKLVGEVELKEPVIQFKRSPTASGIESGSLASLQRQGRRLFPVDINRLAVINGRAVYLNESAEPRIDLAVTQINGWLRDIQTGRSEAELLTSPFHLEAVVFQSGDLLVKGDAFLLKEAPDFRLDLKLSNLELPRLNEMARHYAGFDFESGTCEIVVELEARDRSFEGYIKPILDQVTIMKPEEEFSTPFHALWETVASGIVELFENQPKDRLATRIPLSGTVGDPEVGILPTITNVFRNAFVKAFLPNWEQEES